MDQTDPLQHVHSTGLVTTIKSMSRDAQALVFQQVESNCPIVFYTLHTVINLFSNLMLPVSWAHPVNTHYKRGRYPICGISLSQLPSHFWHVFRRQEETRATTVDRGSRERLYTVTWDQDWPGDCGSGRLNVAWAFSTDYAYLWRRIAESRGQTLSGFRDKKLIELIRHSDQLSGHLPYGMGFFSGHYTHTQTDTHSSIICLHLFLHWSESIRRTGLFGILNTWESHQGRWSSVSQASVRPWSKAFLLYRSGIMADPVLLPQLPNRLGFAKKITVLKCERGKVFLLSYCAEKQTTNWKEYIGNTQCARKKVSYGIALYAGSAITACDE